MLIKFLRNLLIVVINTKEVVINMSIEIVDFKEKYAEELSKIILENMYKINIKEHGKDVIDRLAEHFTPEEIIKNFPEREKCFVA